MSQQPPPGPPPAEPSLVEASRPQRSQGSSALAAALIGLIGLAVVAGLVIVVAGERLFGEVGPPTAAAPPTSANGAAPSSDALAAPAGAATAPVSVEGTSLAEMPDVLVTGADDPAAGSVAPTLRGTDFDGNPVTIGADGRAKVIYFVAHWCPHCQAEVPLIQQLIDSGQKPDNVDIYAVSTAVRPESGNYPPSTWLDREGFSSVTMRDDGGSSAVLAFGAGGFPYAVYLDSQNRVIARSAGELGIDGIAQMWALTSESA
ncbi:MAG: TlpA disulfide reductase family protein [Acidimicrobiales bacterium]